uniref:Permease n=1 Tax=Solibacter usitatus (strain Ellin6076) TaxID=234267 RepID=Q021W2_SOLUE
MSIARALETFAQDVRYGFRTLRSRPVFAATAVATLALAIGGNTAMFTVVRAVLLQPLQYREPDRLVTITGGATPQRFAEMKAGAQSFTEIGAFTGVEDLALSGGAEPEILKGVHVSAGFLRILAADPVRGRGFLPEEDRAGGAPVAMISHELWQRRYGGDPQIVGKTAMLSTTPYTIVGVLPGGFQFPAPGLDVWLTAPSESPSIPLRSRTLSPYLTLFGRLKAGVSLAQANAELRVIRQQYATAHPAMLDAKAKTPVEAAPMKEELVAGVRATLWLLFGAVGFVLLIACANIAGLLLARAASRVREMAVRSAIGAARTRLIGQMLAESVLLSAAGGVLGVLLAAWCLRAIPELPSFNLPRAGEIRLDGTVLGFAAALSLVTGTLFGLAPALRASRPDLMGVLRTSGEAANQAGSRGIPNRLTLRGLLLVGQIALSVVLLIGAALLMESVVQLHRVDVGFNPANLLTARVALPALRYDTDLKKALFFQSLVRQVGATPGVRGATAAWYLPMMGSAGTPVQDANQPALRLNQRPIATLVMITPAYFSTLGIAFRRGRDFAESDTAEAQRVAIINESLARRFWPSYPAGPDPIGQRMLVGGVNPKPAEIVGIVADVHQGLEGSPWAETVYLAFPQNAQGSAVLAIRTAGDPLRFTGAVREQVRRLDRDQPVAGVQSMEDLVEAAVGRRRLLAPLLGVFAGVALLLALIGIYGVISYSVAQRTREMGIRRALGAQHQDILRLVVGQGLALAVAGVAVGIGAAFALTRVMESLLFHVSATDPAIFAGIGALFLLVTAVACYLPARRATRIDPMAALRA